MTPALVAFRPPSSRGRISNSDAPCLENQFNLGAVRKLMQHGVAAALRNARGDVYASCRPDIGLHHATSMSSRGGNSRHRGLVCTRIGGTDGKSLGDSIDTLAKISQAIQLGLRTRKSARSTTIQTRNTSPRPTLRFVWRSPPQRPDATKREARHHRRAFSLCQQRNNYCGSLAS